jgi:hypothetical protein
MSLKLSALAVFVLLITAPVYGQNEVYPEPQPGATETSLGSFLEPRFQTQLGVCISGNPTKMNLKLDRPLRSDKILSAIPPQLADPSVNLRGTVLLMPEQSVGRAFAYVYPSKKIPVTNVAPPVVDYLVADYLENPRLLTERGFNLAYYDYNCSMSIAAALKLNAGWSFPMAQVSSALQNDLNSKNTYHLALVSGTMASPLWKMYNSSAGDDYKTYAQMLIWEWYANHPTAVNDARPSRYLLTQFDGISVYKVLTHSVTNDGKVNVSGSANIAVLDLSGQLETALKTSAEAKVETFGLAARKATAGDSLSFEDFPLASTIATQLTTSGKAHLDPSADLRLSPSTKHTQVITGVSEGVCKRKWSIEKVNNALAGTLGITETSWIRAKDAGSLPTCKFTVSYDTNPVAPGGLAPTQVNLDYYLVSELRDNTNAVKATAKLKADTVSLSSSGLPAIQFSNAPGIPVITTTTAGGVNFYTFQWTFNFPVSEDTKQSEKIASVHPVPNELKLTCGTKAISPLPGSFSYNTTTSVLSLSFSRSTNSSVEPLDMAKPELCTLSGRATFTLNSGTQIQRDIQPTTAFYHQLLPAPSPTPNPNPTPAPSPQEF